MLKCLSTILSAVTYRLSVLNSDRTECYQKLLNGNLSLVKADRGFTYSCLISAVGFDASLSQSLQNYFTP